MSAALAMSVEDGRVVLRTEPGTARRDLAATIQHAGIAFGAPAGSPAAGWSARSVPIQSIDEVSTCLRSLAKSGDNPRLQPGGPGRTVMMLRIEDADSVTAQLHWDIEVEMAQLTTVGRPSIVADGDFMVAMGLVELREARPAAA